MQPAPGPCQARPLTYWCVRCLPVLQEWRQLAFLKPAAANTRVRVPSLAVVRVSFPPLRRTCIHGLQPCMLSTATVEVELSVSAPEQPLTASNNPAARTAASSKQTLVLTHVNPDIMARHDFSWDKDSVAQVLIERFEASLDFEPDAAGRTWRKSPAGALEAAGACHAAYSRGAHIAVQLHVAVTALLRRADLPSVHCNSAPELGHLVTRRER